MRKIYFQIEFHYKVPDPLYLGHNIILKGFYFFSKKLKNSLLFAKKVLLFELKKSVLNKMQISKIIFFSKSIIPFIKKLGQVLYNPKT